MEVRPRRHHRRRSSSSLQKRHLSTLDIARLTICMLGVQFTWTVELGYGTPYLLSLGIPKAITPLVWLAGPLSGLVIQPLVGVFSDTLNWRIGRRRPFIIGGAILTIASMLLVAYANELATLIFHGHAQEQKRHVSSSFFSLAKGGKEGDPPPEHDDNAVAIKNWTIIFAVIGFYCLDFSINAVQASCRSLIMDIPQTHQQEVGNAWSGWMNNLGSVTGFFAGNLNLVHYLPWLGNKQIKVLANLAIFFFSTTLAITCLSVKEIPYERTEEDEERTVFGTIANIWYAFRRLPDTVQRICNVQFFAWMGWFPFLFYVTTWVGEIMNRYDDDPNGSIPENGAERAGSFALLCWASIAVLSGILIPKLTPQEFGVERWPRNPFTLKNLFTMSLIWFAVCMESTWFVDSLWAATAVIALCGVPWAVAMWVPFAMVGEFISNLKDCEAQKALQDAERERRRIAARYGAVDNGASRTKVVASGVEEDESPTLADSAASSAMGRSSSTAKNDPTSQHIHASALERGGGPSSTRSPTPASTNDSSTDDNSTDTEDTPEIDAGLVLGVHNMYIVFPQFLDAIVASTLFAIIGSRPSQDFPHPGPSLPDDPEGGGGQLVGLLAKSWTVVAPGDPEPVGWVLRFGGLMALVAALLSRRL
ncbi:hypothetical protein BGW41_007728 [Actinomortierella wolfii]|nr:hypothetical protein BGW41_007728 [Actinomortierella wolfii]